MNNFLNFGSLSVKKITALLFWVGAAIISVVAVMQGYGVYLTHTYMRTIRTQLDSQHFWTSVEANNLPLGITYGLIIFVLGVLFWRLICEIIYIILDYFKMNTPRKPD